MPEHRGSLASRRPRPQRARGRLTRCPTRRRWPTAVVGLGRVDDRAGQHVRGCDRGTCRPGIPHFAGDVGERIAADRRGWDHGQGAAGKAGAACNLAGLERWRWIAIGEQTDERREGYGSATGSGRDTVLRPTRLGSYGRHTWPKVIEGIEIRRRDRFGAAIDELNEPRSQTHPPRHRSHHPGSPCKRFPHMGHRRRRG